MPRRISSAIFEEAHKVHRETGRRPETVLLGFKEWEFLRKELQLQGCPRELLPDHPGVGGHMHHPSGQVFHQGRLYGMDLVFMACDSGLLVTTERFQHRMDGGQRRRVHHPRFPWASQPPPHDLAPILHDGRNAPPYREEYREEVMGFDPAFGPDRSVSTTFDPKELTPVQTKRFTVPKVIEPEDQPGMEERKWYDPGTDTTYIVRGRELAAFRGDEVLPVDPDTYERIMGMSPQPGDPPHDPALDWKPEVTGGSGTL